MNLAAAAETTKRRQKEFATTLGPLESIIVRVKSIDNSDTSINWILHEPKYIAPPSVGLFKGKHHEITNAANMEDQASREKVLHWIAKQIAIDGENKSWVITIPLTIAKATLTYPTKVWWVVVRSQLRPMANDNTLSPSHASLESCLLSGYPVNREDHSNWNERQCPK